MLDMVDQGSVHDLTEYSVAIEVIKSHTKIINIYAKLIPVLYHFAAYQAVWPVLQLVEESKLLAETQLAYYQNVLKTKGKIDAVKTKRP